MSEVRNVPNLRFPRFDGEWQTKKLGTLTTKMQSGVSRKLSDEDVGLPILRSNNISDGVLNVKDIKYWHLIDDQGTDLNNYILAENDILVNFINSIAQIGKTALFKNYLKRNTIFTTNILRLSTSSEVDSRFLFYNFNTLQYFDYIKSITKPAVNQASFTTKEFNNYLVNVPSLAEQIKIVNNFEQIDFGIALLKKKKTLLEIYKKGMMQKIFNQEIRFKDENGKDFGKWEVTAIKDLPIYISDGNYGEQYPKASEMKSEGIPFIRANNIKNSQLVQDDMKYIDPELHEILTSGHLREHDIIVTTRGDIGSIAYVTKEFDNANINAQICLLRTSKNVNSKYLFQVLSTGESKKQFNDLQTGSALKQLPKGNLKKISFKIPCIEEQSKIANFLSAIDDKINLVAVQIEKMEKFKKGLLGEMFV